MSVVGEAVLSASLEVLFHKLASSDLLKFSCRGQVHAAIRKWENMLLKIHAVLDDAEEKQIAQRAVKIWLGELRDLAYDMEDILDELATEALRRKLMVECQASSSKVNVLIPNCFTSLSPTAVKFNVRVEAKIKQMTCRLQDICKQRIELGLESVMGEKSTKIWQRSPTTSLVIESCVYGRDRDKEKIVELMLMDEGSDAGVGVIPIVGMGGVGKTTLAQLVYGDHGVNLHFDIKAWVYVSTQFDIMRISKAILESITLQACEFEDFDQIQVKLKDTLAGKRFLVVLDDLWNREYNSWDILKNPLRVGAKGSKILVTTRNRDIGLMMGTVEYHYLEQLSDDDCWSVFAQHAFGKINADAHPNLEFTGKKIVEKCGGLPLAAKTLGGLLCGKTKESEWEETLHSKIWDLAEEQSGIIPALRLSYYHLPSHLKRCFMYCAILPKGYEFEEKELIWLWMAEGLIQQPKGWKRMEDLGDEYFHELLSRSFFQPANNGLQFVMHDLINDLAQSVSGKICFKLEGNKAYKISEKARHSSYVQGNHDGKIKFAAFNEAKSLRTFLPFNLLDYNSHLTNYVPLELLPKLRYLRVLSLRNYLISELPEAIGNLKHLRYLNFSYTEIRSLPKSTSTLYNLQTLILKGCYMLKTLPTEMRKLINLGHLDFTDSDSVENMPLRMGTLTSLQTLSNFLVGKSGGSRISELKTLWHLQGSLSISRLENVTNAQDAREASLNDKPGLTVLQMKWSSEFNNLRNQKVEMEVLDMLQPHKNLTELNIKYYAGTRFPAWIGDPLYSNMMVLRLAHCEQCTSLPPLGQLPWLKELCIKGMKGVKFVGLEFFGGYCSKPFPSLEILSFEDMEEWEDWFVDEEVEVFSFLCELYVKRCPKLMRQLPKNLSHLAKLVIWECKQLVVTLSSLPSLKSLDIVEVDQLIMKNTKDLCSLTSFRVCEVDVCEDEALRNVAFHQLNIVTSWDVCSSPNLRCLPKCFTNGLGKLEELEIDGCQELMSLWHLEGSLQHQHQHFNSLRRLMVSSCPQLAFFEGEGKEEEMQHGLPCGLEYLRICCCDKLEKLPRGLYTLTTLAELSIRGCPSMTSLPETGLPSALRRLEIQNCRALNSLTKGMTHSTNLEYVSISNCPSLMSLSSKGMLPSTLKRLEITHCQKLESIAEVGMATNSSLESMVIWTCENLKSLPDGLNRLRYLHCLSIGHCGNLLSLPKGGLPATNLRKLVIFGCEKLGVQPNCMRSLTSLQQLSIGRCPRFISFLEGGFPTNLRSLHIGDTQIVKPLSEWGLHRLTSLTTVHIHGTSLELVSFPDDESKECMILPNSLTRLAIHNFPNLEKLCSKGFQNPSFLEHLEIHHCPKLSSVPEALLPPSLLSLNIHNSPMLARQFARGKGQYWSKVAHVPHVVISKKLY
ncbi:putative disease resistance RPP13-like protein 1 [Malania oleifera]|uniref:putative disease resistance RPP13-like protein 1 n=1 Tax=Malania oleifera TaxID=397392 RepID=UPI0025ADDD19|nr:putative disease resistance RPP13-like protein 1 [Malania oleifera]